MLVRFIKRSQIIPVNRSLGPG